MKENIENIFDRSFSPKEAFDILNKGNFKYLNEMDKTNLKSKKLRKIFSEIGQFPLATILACSDSRQPIELIFNLNIGDLFTIKIPGNIVNNDILGSIEFGISFLKTPLLIVLGHTQCGAVTAAFENIKFGNNFDRIIDYINPLIKNNHNKDSSINDIIEENVRYNMKKILSSSLLIQKAINSKKLEIKGGVYDIKQGNINWIN